MREVGVDSGIFLRFKVSKVDLVGDKEVLI